MMILQMDSCCWGGAGRRFKDMVAGSACLLWRLIDKSRSFAAWMCPSSKREKWFYDLIHADRGDKISS